MNSYTTFEEYISDLMKLPILLTRGSSSPQPLTEEDTSIIFETFAALYMEISQRAELTGNFAITPYHFICNAYNLSLPDRLALLLSVAPYWDSRFKVPTIGQILLALQLVYSPSPEEISYFFMPNSVKRLLFWYPDSGNGVVTSEFPLALHTEIVSSLFGRVALSANAARFCTLFQGKVPADELILREETVTQLKNLLLQPKQDTCIVALSGHTGSGRKFMLSAAAGQVSHQVLFINFKELILQARNAICDTLEDIRRIYILNDFEICFSEVPDHGSSEIFELCLSVVMSYCPLIFITTSITRFSDFDKLTVPMLVIPASPITSNDAGSLFEHYMDKSCTDTCFLDCTNALKLLPKDVRDIVTLAKMSSQKEGLNSVSDVHIKQGISLLHMESMGGFGDFIPLSYTWKDLVVPRSVSNAMKLVCAHIKYSEIVMDTWGFHRKVSYGKGTTVLFYGAPGTGKTMAAQIMAREVNMPLFRVDSSQINSKYVGETQKNLCALFDHAKDNNLVLFFDEADSFFAKRSTDTQNSNSKYANNDTSFLLQKIEEYDGLSILCTNLAANIDDAFKRRITYMINLPFPDVALRRQIWESLITDEMPHDNLDFDFLSNLELQPAAIKSILTSALYISVSNGGILKMEYIIYALKYYYSKYGKLMDSTDFGKYWNFYSAL